MSDKRLLAIWCGTSTPGFMGGGDRVVWESWSRWQKLGLANVTMLISAFGAIALERFGFNINTIVVDGKGIPVNPLRLGYLLRLLGALRIAWRRNDYAVIYAGTPYFYDYFPALVTRLRARTSPALVVNLPHIIPRPWERHGGHVSNVLAWFEQRMMIQIVRRTADLVIADNPEVREDLVRRGVAENRIALIKMGVFAKARPYPNGGRAYDAIYVGRLARQKGTHTLLDAWSLIVHDIPKARLALVGRNELDFDVQKEIAERKLENCVDVHGNLDDGEVVEALRRSRVFVTGSLEEGFGLSVLEAMGVGLPCVTFDIPAFRFAFPLGRLAADEPTAASLAKALESVLTNESLYQRLESEVQTMPIVTWDEAALDLWESVTASAPS